MLQLRIENRWDAFESLFSRRFAMFSDNGSVNASVSHDRALSSGLARLPPEWMLVDTPIIVGEACSAVVNEAPEACRAHSVIRWF